MADANPTQKARRDKRFRHGHAHYDKEKRPPEYGVWCAMLRRCRNPNVLYYENYGGRGIRVCDRWLRFENFLADMGFRPSRRHMLDRKDSNGNYEPGNCRWVTRVEQNRNKRTNRLLTAFGKTQCLAAWAEETGMRALKIHKRIKHGWSIEQALTP